MRSKSQIVAELSRMLRDVFAARSNGVNHARLARAHGYVDGYMRALLESGQVTKHELLEIVAAERAHVDGPALREVVLETAADIAAA